MTTVALVAPGAGRRRWAGLPALAGVLALSGALSACLGGGGDDAGAVGSARFPDSATQSVAAFIGYLKGLMADDRAEPLDVAGIDLPVSDTDEPLPVE